MTRSERNARARRARVATVLVLGTLSASALAADEPQLKAEARRRYPNKLYDDRTIERECAFDVTLDARGHVTDATVVSCPDELSAFAERIVRRDRWRKPVVEGTVARVTARFLPPIDVFQFPHPDTWRFREGPVCDVHLAVGEDGTVRVRSATEGCAPTVDEATPVPPAPWAGQVSVLPIVCPVTFLTQGGEKRDVQLFRCPPSTWAHARDVLDALSWPAPDRAWAVVRALAAKRRVSVQSAERSG